MSKSKSNFYKSRKWKRKRETILKRDEYLCRECKRYGRTTPATTIHHIQTLEYRPELVLVSQNLISLCSECHNAMHDRDSRALTALGQTWVERTRTIG